MYIPPMIPVKSLEQFQRERRGVDHDEERRFWMDCCASYPYFDAPQHADGMLEEFRKRWRKGEEKS